MAPSNPLDRSRLSRSRDLPPQCGAAQVAQIGRNKRQYTR